MIRSSEMNDWQQSEQTSCEGALTPTHSLFPLGLSLVVSVSAVVYEHLFIIMPTAF